MGLYQDIKEDVNGNAFFNLNDSAGNGITSTNNAGKQSLDVNITGGATSAAVADKTTYTYGTTSFQNVGGVFQDTSPTLTAGQSGAFRLTANRAIHMNLRTAAGVEIGVTGSAVVVDGSAVTQPISAASLPLPTGAATEATVTAINSKMSPATGTLSSVPVNTASTTVLASNAARKGAIIFNDGIDVVKIALAATASATAYTYRIQANGTLELCMDRVYTGIITHISATATGNLRVTELT